MTLCERLAKAEHRLRPLMLFLPPPVAVKIFSLGRRKFLEQYVKDRPDFVTVPQELSRTLWGIKFRSPIMNAAGMFKTAEAYHVASRQGAGAVLFGTITHHPRPGITMGFYHQPCASYPYSGNASNKLSFPNPSFEGIAPELENIIKNHKVDGCPVGMNLATVHEEDEQIELSKVVVGMDIAREINVDFNSSKFNCSAPKLGQPSLYSIKSTFISLVFKLIFLTSSFRK